MLLLKIEIEIDGWAVARKKRVTLSATKGGDEKHDDFRFETLSRVESSRAGYIMAILSE